MFNRTQHPIDIYYLILPHLQRIWGSILIDSGAPEAESEGGKTSPRQLRVGPYDSAHRCGLLHPDMHLGLIRNPTHLKPDVLVPPGACCRTIHTADDVS